MPFWFQPKEEYRDFKFQKLAGQLPVKGFCMTFNNNMGLCIVRRPFEKMYFFHWNIMLVLSKDFSLTVAVR